VDLDRFYRRHARIYDLTRFYLFDRRRALAAVGAAPGRRVIDFGCGTGRNLPALLAAGAGVTGVDASDAMLDVARRKAPGAELVQADAATVRLPPADAVLCTYALSMMSHWRDVLANLHAHLRPGGTLVLLDFDRLRGPARLISPLHHAWFDRFDVRLGLPAEEVLDPLFDLVTRESRHAGWNFLVVARGARPAPSPAAGPAT
jgi:ubiquinone/menaquinone biosynthesis C-methylase UbiE